MEEPLIYDFKTKNGNYYVYDASTNYTYPVDRLDIAIIKNFKRMSLDQLRSCLYPEYTNKQVEQSHEKISQWIEQDKSFYPNWGKQNKASMPSKEEYFSELSNLSQIILELTQNCNLRCKYCVYSGIYNDQRIHNTAKMSWEIAKRSIDFYLKLINSPSRTSTRDEIFVSFYGGESLLEFKLLKRSVEYLNSLKLNHKIKFNITTNGTLLNEEIIQFCMVNNFRLLISLDGPNSEHDKHRVTVKSKGTFNVIYDKLRIIRKISKKYYKRQVNFIAVYSPLTKLSNVINFYSRRSPYTNRKLIRLDPMSPNYSKEFFENINDGIVTKSSIEIGKLFNNFISLKSNHIVTSYKLHVFDILFGNKFNRINKRNCGYLEDAKFTAASCIPGAHRLFVDSNGFFHCCEKINHHFPIGNCWNGIQYQKVKNVYDNFLNHICDKCYECIALRNCDICLANSTENNHFVKNNLCRVTQNSFKSILKNYYSIMETNPHVFKIKSTS